MSTKAFSDEVSKLLPILRALSDKDSLRILLEASKGLPSGLEAPRILGMTKRRYYIRLRELIKVGLLKKIDNSYHLTVIGEFIKREIYDELLRAIPYVKTLEQLSELGMNTLENIGSFIPGLSDSDTIHMTHLLRPPVGIDIIKNYEELIRKICKGIQDARKIVLLASRYFDLTFAKYLIESLEREIKIYVVTDFDMPSLLSFAIKFIKNYKMIIPLIKLLKNEKILVRRTGNLPISFMIIDEIICIFELPSLTKEFETALWIDYKPIVEKMTDIFWKIWGKSTNIDLKDLLERDISTNQ
jgi:predicted transcriptional regulator